ncbi:MAG: hypothetical protein QGI83_09615, partial [Candidatus Latescibacteria bacterium]|nr:hypothetical protein [Candidatus Latescibacterota bacterium]
MIDPSTCWSTFISHQKQPISPIPRAELANLRSEEVQVLIQIRIVTGLGFGKLVMASLVGIVSLVPVGDRVVEAQGDVAPVASVGQLAQDVSAVGRVHRVVVRLRRIPEAEAVVMLGGDDE